MSYFFTKPEKIEYRNEETEAYRILRRCAGCKKKRSYHSTGNFRVNANGNKIDVWLIYQCPKCKHTYNLTIYERLHSSKLNEENYRNFMDNDAGTALKYGRDKSIFVRNKAQIDYGKEDYLEPRKQTKKV